MPKIGMEPLRREALLRATIDVIGEAGTLNVTVSQIAKRAGMSSALAHHYFGGKDQIFLAAMARILTDFAVEVRRQLARSPNDKRAEAIVAACFADEFYDPGTISAWMCFYVLARSDVQALRLWRVYQSRTKSTLAHALRGQCADPQTAAATMIAVIDGLYIRSGLDAAQSPQMARDHALFVLTQLKEAKSHG